MLARGAILFDMTLRNTELTKNLEALYANQAGSLLFHGWHHVRFVVRKSLEFAKELGVNAELVEAAALTHDLNYLTDTTSTVDAGAQLRTEQLMAVGYTAEEISVIENIVHTASTGYRDADISDMAKALSDADALFKVLPVGPMILSARFITETKTDLHKWAQRIIREQQPLLDGGIYFYTQTARDRYLDWAKLNLEWVATVQRSLDDPDTQLFLEDCKKLGYV